MADQGSFGEFVRRIRAGDSRAAEELVRRYEPALRLEVRCRLQDRRLRRVFDSMDVCQAVLMSFFPRAALGQFDLQRPEQLLGLLKEMARHKLASVARGQARRKRDHRRAAGAEGLEQVAAADASPSEEVAGRELLARFEAALDDESRRLVHLRQEGLSWDEVALRVGGTAQARRMQLARALERAARELGLEADAPAA